MTHLILHKVRGEPAFDVAQELEVGNETWWIIPTSGHRAYPFQKWPVNELFALGGTEILSIPEDWPDHYEIDKGTKTTFDMSALLSNLIPKIKRRI